MSKVNSKKSNRSSSTVVRSSNVSVYTDPTLMSNIQERVVSLLDRRGGEWQGSMTELETALRNVDRARTPANWPGSASVMRKVFNGVASRLRRNGVRVKFDRETDSFRKRVVSLEIR